MSYSPSLCRLYHICVNGKGLNEIMKKSWKNYIEKHNYMWKFIRILRPYVARQLKTPLDYVNENNFQEQPSKWQWIRISAAVLDKSEHRRKLFLRSPCRKRVQIKVCYDFGTLAPAGVAEQEHRSYADVWIVLCTSLAFQQALLRYPGLIICILFVSGSSDKVAFLATEWNNVDWQSGYIHV